MCERQEVKVNIISMYYTIQIIYSKLDKLELQCSNDNM